MTEKQKAIYRSQFHPSYKVNQKKGVLKNKSENEKVGRMSEHEKKGMFGIRMRSKIHMEERRSMKRRVYLAAEENLVTDLVPSEMAVGSNDIEKIDR